MTVCTLYGTHIHILSPLSQHDVKQKILPLREMSSTGLGENNFLKVKSCKYFKSVFPSIQPSACQAVMKSTASVRNPGSASK